MPSVFITCENCYTEYQIPEEPSPTAEPPTCPCCNHAYVEDWDQFVSGDYSGALIEYLGESPLEEEATGPTLPTAPGADERSVDEVLDEVPTQPGSNGRRRAVREEPETPVTVPSRITAPLRARPSTPRVTAASERVQPGSRSEDPVDRTPIALAAFAVATVLAAILLGGVYLILPGDGPAPGDITVESIP